MTCPEKFQFANEFGIIRKEGVFSTIDVRNVVNQNEDACACEKLTTKLGLCENISRNCQKGVTTTLIEAETGQQFCIPAGSIIHQFVVIDRTCANLSCDLAFMLGFLSECIEDEARLGLLAQRIADESHQLTGLALNVFGRAHFDLKLTAAALAEQLAIYNAEDIDNGIFVQDLDLAFVTGGNFVGEPKSLMPAITVTSGELCVNDLDFFMCWTPPCSGVVMRPVVVAEPCSPKKCTRGSCNSPCSPRGIAGRGCGGTGCNSRGGSCR